MGRPRKVVEENQEEVVVSEPVKVVEEKQVVTSFNISNSFWCKDLDRMVFRGVYKAKTEKEVKAITKYLDSKK